MSAVRSCVPAHGPLLSCVYDEGSADEVVSGFLLPGEATMSAEPSVDVLAAQVREGLYPRRHVHLETPPGSKCSLCARHLALDVLVARVTEAEEAAGSECLRLHNIAVDWQGRAAKAELALADARNALERAFDEGFRAGYSFSDWGGYEDAEQEALALPSTVAKRAEVVANERS